MWIMECDRHIQRLNYSSTKFRPLIPRPNPNALYGSNPTQFPTVTPSSRFPSNPNLTARNHSPSGVVPLVSTRWNPTPEQVGALEEMYRKGTRTPSAEQIQQIVAKLRRFGKVEGKNVFYWFQNHKARERQKKRRHEMEALAGRKIVRHGSATQGRQSGLSRRHLEIGDPKKLSTSLAIQYSATSSVAIVEEGLCQQDNRWTQTAAEGSTEYNCCQLDLLSRGLSPNNSMDNIKAAATGQENESPVVEFRLFGCKNGDLGDVDEIGENQTLELFPVKGNDLGKIGKGLSNVGTTSRLGPNHQFFEFLPTKN